MGRRKYSDDRLDEMARQVEASALQYWEIATEEQRSAGRGWYPTAHAEARLMAEHYRMPVTRAAAIIAVLSPLTRWSGNLEDAWSVCEGGKAKHALPRNEAKALRLKDGESIANVIGGRKVTSFWLNIANPLHFEGTTNDSWIARAFGISESDMFNVYGVYDAVTGGLALAAKRLGELPSTVQATVWLVTREAWERNNDQWADGLPVPF